MPRHAFPPRLFFSETRQVWEIRFRDTRARRLSTGFGRGQQAEAEQQFQDWLAQRERASGPGDPDKTMISEVLATYGEKHAPFTADPVRIGECIVALLSFWQHMTVAGITGDTSRGYVAHRKRQIAKLRGKTPSEIGNGTPRKELGTLNAAIGFCIGEGYLRYGRRAILPSKPAPRDRWLEEHEALALIDAARRITKVGNFELRRDHLVLWLLIALRTGARKSAILQLQWSANTVGGWVNLERGRIDFRIEGQQKSKKRRAHIPIPESLLPELQAAYERRKTNYVIEWKGKPVKNIKTAFREACRVAGLEGVTPHILKHTAITWLMQQGVDAASISAWTETSESTIREVYGHHHPDYMKDAKAAMDRILIPEYGTNTAPNIKSVVQFTDREGR